MKKNVLIIGAGGVAKVVAHKCAQHNDELGRIAIASRNISKCQAIIDSVKAKGSLKEPADIKAFSLNAMDVEATKALIRETGSQIVINVGSAFLNMSVLRACIDTGVAYLDTAIHEEPGKNLRDAALVRQLRVEAPRGMQREEHHRDPRCGLRPGCGQRLCSVGTTTVFRPY